MKAKVLFIIDNLTGGGAEKMLIHVLRRIDRDRFDVSLLTVVKYGIYVPDVPSDIRFISVFGDGKVMKRFGLFPLFRLYRRLGAILFRKYPYFVSQFIRIPDFDIGISFCHGDNMPLLWTLKRHFRKTVLWIHGDMRISSRRFILKRFPRETASVDRFIFVSEAAKDAFIETFPEHAHLRALMSVIYNPLDFDSIKHQGIRRKRENPDELQVIAIGRLDKGKSFNRLISVHHRLLDDGIRHELVILGKGPEYEALEQQITELGVGTTCRLAGFQNPYPYLAAADIFVLSSINEALPTVIAEAMVLCKPIVSTRVAGADELLEDGRFGIITENSEKGIYDGLKEMLTNSALRKHFEEELTNCRDEFVFTSDVHNIEEKLLKML
ncbi:MAG: glycosyltransferase [Dysgonamonadaceae bacterium]|jgi:glycosyltransferase involved in cell wall biosynthesis|nr:glycosyltransferase [Dysgonamonadaceae bacterium]